MTQNICNQYPHIVKKIAHFYGWDKPSEQCTWMLNSMKPNFKNEFEAFTYLVENCMKLTNDRELDYFWFEALKQNNEISKVA